MLAVFVRQLNLPIVSSRVKKNCLHLCYLCIFCVALSMWLSNDVTILHRNQMGENMPTLCENCQPTYGFHAVK